MTQQQIEQLLKHLPSATSNFNKSSYDIDEEIDYNFASIAYSSYAESASTDWILDIGATDHMISKITKLKAHQNAQDRSRINLPNSNTASITAVGNVELVNYIALTNTLVVPEFKFN